MKKIYILTAVFALLTLSLNAQVGAEKMESKAPKKTESIRAQKSTYQPKGQVPTMSQLLQGIEGMSSVLQAGSHTDGVASSNGSWRAPLKVNADEYTVGPFTGDNISSTALGFGSQYYDPQWVTITTELARSEFENHIGDEIVGFRFALGGNTSRVHDVSNFTVIPRTASGLDDNNAYNWKLADLTPGSTIDTYDDIVITTLNGFVGFKSIIVYSGSTVVEQWIGTSNETTTPEGWTWTGGSHFASNGDGSYYMTYGSSSGGGVLTISASLLNGYCSGDITVVINAAIDAGSSSEENLQIDVNGDIKALTNENPSFQDFTWTISPSGTSTAEYVELNGSYGGTWHEFYLDEPIVFNPASDVEKLRMGYTVHQYPSSDTEHYLYPVAFNDQSTGHDHYAHMYAAQTTSGGNQTKTVANGSATSNNVPVRAGYQDYGWRTQMIYTGDMLGIDAGSQITSLTFYPGTNGINFSGSTVQLKLGHTSSNNFGTSSNTSTSQLTPSDLTLVATVSPTTDASATEWVFTFDQPFTYNGGNLLVDLYCEGYNHDGISGSYSFSTSFYGESQTAYQSLYVVGTGSATPPTSKTGSNTQFLPKATFGYTGTSTTYVQQWWNVTNSFSSRGDLAVQLIFKSQLPKTDTPAITVTEGDAAYTITATGNGTVTMVVGGQTYTSDEGSVSVTINRGNTDQTVAVSATAQEEGKRVSDPATQDVIVPALPITPTPVITYNETATEMVITATGQGTVTMIVDGQTYSGEGTVSVTIPRGLEDRTVTATATAVAPNHQPSAQAEETITIHEAGRSPMPTFTFTDNGDGSYTVTVTGTGEVNVYINDAEHGGTAGDPIATGNGSVSFTVEEHSQAMTLPLQATNQEEGLAVSRTAEATYNIPAMTITDDFKPLDPQPANANTPINLSKLMFVDRFSKEIPDRNNHPRLYDYYLQETQVRQRTSNSVEVEVKHTGSDGMGFYTLTQIDNDTIVGLDRKQGLKMNVRNAAMEIPLEPDPKVFFYTVERGTRAYPDQADRKWLGVLQRTTDGNYQETLNPSYDYEEVYPARPHIHYDTDTIDGEYNEYLTYVPVVWTMGFDRYNYMMGIDEVHNSYGAPKWRTGVADVNVETVNVERQLGTLGSTNWTEAGIPCSMYMIDTLTVKGFMPTVNTMPYEPYMFRVFVESKNGKLRGYKKVGDGAVINDGTHYEGDGNGPQTGPICVWSEYVKGSKYMGFTDNTVTFSRGKISEVDTLNHWIVPDYKNMMFAATDTLLTEVDLNGNTVIQKDELNIFVRFYYIVEGSAEGHTPGLMSLRGNRDGDGEAPAGYGSESPGTSPSPSTAVREISVGSGTIVSQTYYNVQGMESDQPFNGVNIVVTRYSDGTTRTSKVVIVR